MKRPLIMTSFAMGGLAFLLLCWVAIYGAIAPGARRFVPEPPGASASLILVISAGSCTWLSANAFRRKPHPSLPPKKFVPEPDGAPNLNNQQPVFTYASAGTVSVSGISSSPSPPVKPVPQALPEKLPEPAPPPLDFEAEELWFDEPQTQMKTASQDVPAASPSPKESLANVPADSRPLEESLAQEIDSRQSGTASPDPRHALFGDVSGNRPRKSFVSQGTSGVNHL